MISINIHDKNTMLGVEVIHEIRHLDSVHFLINRSDGKTDNKEAIEDHLIGTTVMTTYNKKTYQVNGILWDMTPLNEFEYKGFDITYAWYFKYKYKITVIDLSQRLIFDDSNMTNGFIEPVHLIPEFCNLIGISNAMRRNCDLIQELNQYMSVVPANALKSLDKFMKRVKGTAEVT